MPLPDPRRLLRRREGGGEERGTVLVQALAFVLALSALVACLAVLGYDPGLVLPALWDGSVGAPGSLDVALGHAVPLMLTATAVWLAYQAGMFNVGPDGQLQLAGIATVAVITQLPEDWGVLLIVVGVLAGVLVGALCAVVAVVLKLWRGASEVITTLMTVFIAINLVNVLIAGPLRAPDAKLTASSERIPADAQLGSFLGTPLTWGVLIALAVTALVLAIVVTTTAGLRLRAVGRNELAALRAGIPVSRLQFAAFTAGGALSGLAGALVLVGLRYEVSPGWAPLWGFGGILIAFIALRTPALIPVWGILFGMLLASGPTLKGSASVPDAIVVVMQTLPVIALFLIEAIRRGWRARAAARVSHV
jgi:ABC-type uncharacterized transport system permease subunit